MLGKRKHFENLKMFPNSDFTYVLQGTVFKNDVSGNARTVSILVE